MPVGGQHQPVAGRRRGQAGTVVALGEEGVVKGAGEEFVDQLRSGAATGTVAHVDAPMFDVQRPHVVRPDAHAAAPAAASTRIGMSRNRP